jgi:membrane protein implicated in regulation of membrane protease activity
VLFVAESAEHFRRSYGVALIVAILLALYVVPLPWSIALIVVGIIVEIGESVFWWKLSHRRRPKVGVETLIGTKATVVTPCRPAGQVRVAGELWQAICEEGADPGDLVVVDAVNGLTLAVSR